MDIEIYKEHAMDILDLALEFDKLDMFLVGGDVYRLSDFNTPVIQHDSYLVMQAVYDKYNQNPELELDKKVYEAIIKLLETEKYEPFIINIISDIEYQLMSEQQKTAPFELNCIEILKKLRENIERNKERFKSGSTNMWGRLENHDKIINTHYGHKIL